MPNLRSIVVLNAHYTGLGIARSLRDLPVKVYALTGEESPPGRWSRCLEFVRSPDTEVDPTGAARFPTEFRSTLGDRPLLVPTRDHDIHFLQKHRTELSAGFDLAIADDDVLARVLDKQSLFEVARNAGVECPQSQEVGNFGQLETALVGMMMPIVVKPAVSRDWRRPLVRALVAKNKAFIFDNPRDIRDLYNRLEPVAPRVVLQEFIPGDERQLEIFGSYIGTDSVPKAYFTARKLLQYPRECGNGVALRAEPMPSDLTESSLKLLRALRYTGASEVEFKRHAGNDRLYLIELNARHWDQHRLGDAVGASVARAMYEDWVGKPKGHPKTQAKVPVTFVIEDNWLEGVASAVKAGDGAVWDYLKSFAPQSVGHSGTPASLALQFKCSTISLKDH